MTADELLKLLKDKYQAGSLSPSDYDAAVARTKAGSRDPNPAATARAVRELTEKNRTGVLNAGEYSRYMRDLTKPQVDDDVVKDVNGKTMYAPRPADPEGVVRDTEGKVVHQPKSEPPEGTVTDPDGKVLYPSPEPPPEIVAPPVTLNMPQEAPPVLGLGGEVVAPPVTLNMPPETEKPPALDLAGRPVGQPGPFAHPRAQLAHDVAALNAKINSGTLSEGDRQMLLQRRKQLLAGY